MRTQRIISGAFALIILAGFIARPSELIQGATKGLLICADVIVPSLFPFTAVSIFLFSCGFMRYVEKAINPVTKRLFGLNGSAFCVVLMSFAGGFPVGARLIDELAAKKSISENTARRMLCYCVNPGPAFVIVGIGQTLLNNQSVGVILYFSNILSSLILCIILSIKEQKEKRQSSYRQSSTESVSEIFVRSVSDASSSIIGICSFVILFSTLIQILLSISQNELTDRISALMEISNGTVLFSKNIVYLSFLTSFSGLCVHMQILTVCKNFKVRYLTFLISRIISGLLSMSITTLFLKIFRISVPVISLNRNLFDNLSGVSLPLSAALIFMSVTLLISLKQNNVEKCKRM